MLAGDLIPEMIKMNIEKLVELAKISSHYIKISGYKISSIVI